MTRSEKRRREISGEGASLEPVHDGSQQQATSADKQQASSDDKAQAHE